MKRARDEDTRGNTKERENTSAKRNLNHGKASIRLAMQSPSLNTIPISCKLRTLSDAVQLKTEKTNWHENHRNSEGSFSRAGRLEAHSIGNGIIRRGYEQQPNIEMTDGIQKWKLIICPSPRTPLEGCKGTKKKQKTSKWT